MALRDELQTIEGEQARVAEAIAATGHVEALAASLRQREQRRLHLQGELQVLDGSAALVTFDAPRVAHELRRRVEEWRGLVTRQTPIARQALDRLLDGQRIVCTPSPADSTHRYRGRLRFDRLLAGVVVLAQGMASPTGFEPVFWP